jgi:hypothetical protein
MPKAARWAVVRSVVSVPSWTLKVGGAVGSGLDGAPLQEQSHTLQEERPTQAAREIAADFQGPGFIYGV